MRFQPLDLAGAWVVDLEPVEDERGFFARTWCQRELAEHGLETGLAQGSLSFNHRAGTLRGMHWQAPPCAETKLVRCTRGAIYDVVLDVRSESATFGRWAAVTLSAENRRALYVPRGCAHGFQTLDDNTEVHYLISEFYAPARARGVRWDDPRFGIRWPLPVTVISAKDQNYPDFGSSDPSI
jgi:dTDP-4-dehydrorhamnose 3,5-epimerase